MQPLQIYSVIPKLPKSLEPLRELAGNFLFAWNDEIRNLFARIDPDLWEESRTNPVWFLNHLPQSRIEEIAADKMFLDELESARKQLKEYLAAKKSAAPFPGSKSGRPVVAYFSLEFGVSAGLPIYSGGLGILAGDHLKSASDLNLPLCGVGLTYKHGYFRQYLTPDGWQQEKYPNYDNEQFPLELVRDESGSTLKVGLDLGGQPLMFRIWRADIGRVPLYLLDTNISENPDHLRQISSQLYGGGLEMRLWQEILLGIGGVKALERMGLDPSIIHMNEGHSAFAGLERIRVFMAEHDLSLEAAIEAVASSSVFTTHTPVPAGNDRFPQELIQPYFEKYAQDMGLAFKVLLALGRENPRDDAEHFCMTVLALRLSRFNNGVSELHGHVSRDMWKRVWPQYPTEDVPIGSITNGVHQPSWVADEMAVLYDRYLGSGWREEADCQAVWKTAGEIPDAELWRTHERLRERLVDFVRHRLKKQLKAKGARTAEIEAADDVLDPHALTIGFARRFATYKRANLLLRDKERLVRLIGNREKPVQFIFAGKAHPRDTEGKKLIQELIQLCQQKDCRASMVFLEDYDMEVAAYMTQGCDVWLNTPRPPLEACGTSGMKAMANGVLNVSTLDGWWAEAFRSDYSLGWSIGRGEVYDDHEYQDFVESQTLYRILEDNVVSAFYDRSHGNMPRKWITKMKRGLLELGPVFNSHRMVMDYYEKAYLPSYENVRALARNDFAPAKELAAWRMEVMTEWDNVRIREVRSESEERLFTGEPMELEAEVSLGGLGPEDVSVEVYSGALDQAGHFAGRVITPMKHVKPIEDGRHVFKGMVSPGEPGRFGLTLRILPKHPLLLDPHSLGLIRWAEG